MQFTVDGKERPIHRSARKDSQAYTVNLRQGRTVADMSESLATGYRPTEGAEVLLMPCPGMLMWRLRGWRIEPAPVSI